MLITTYEGEPFCNLEEVTRGQVGKASKALRFLHEQGILHGDIRLSNIVVSAAGAVNLIDFGLSQFINSSRAMELEMDLLRNIAHTE